MVLSWTLQTLRNPCSPVKMAIKVKTFQVILKLWGKEEQNLLKSMFLLKLMTFWISNKCEQSFKDADQLFHFLIRYVLLIFEQGTFFTPKRRKYLFFCSFLSHLRHLDFPTFFVLSLTWTGQCQTGSLVWPGKRNQRTRNSHRGTT